MATPKMRAVATPQHLARLDQQAADGDKTAKQIIARNEENLAFNRSLRDDDPGDDGRNGDEEELSTD